MTLGGDLEFLSKGTGLVAVVQTLRRQSERKVRETVVSELRERLEQLRRSAIRLEAGKWTALTGCEVRGRLEEVAYCLWMVRGFPGRGGSYTWAMEYPLPGHRVVMRGHPANGPVGFAVSCRCVSNPLAENNEFYEWGWSPTVMGAKRLARRHAGLM